MLIFGLFMLLMMLMVGGLSVDIMRHETNRARMQATLDRAVLAAASLDQTADAAGTRAIVADYFNKAGVQGELGEVESVVSINSRSVSATASADLRTFFMRLVGIPELTVPASTAALERVQDIEIVLVLDVSGSMIENGSSRLDNLKTAAREFVDAVLADNPEQRITIALVPFNGQVNLGEALRAKHTVTDRVDQLYGVANVNCVDLPPSAYDDLTLSQTAPMPATAWADTFTPVREVHEYRDYTSGTPYRLNRWCPATPENVVRLPSHDAAELKEHVDGLVGIGATSINAGMRWGLTLLDPSTQPMFAQLRAADQVPAAFANQPYEFNRADTRKIIVLMTDGENFPEERVNDDFRSGPSGIWRNTNPEGNYSIFHSSRVNHSTSGAGRAANIAASRPFWVPHLSQWQARPWNGTSPNAAMPYVDSTSLKRTDRDGDNDCDHDDDGFGPLMSNEACWFDAAERTWPQVWANLRLSWVSWQLYARALTLSTGVTGTNLTDLHKDQMNLFRTKTKSSDMDAQLLAMCDLARANNVAIYGIAFEAPEKGQAAIRNCVTGDSRLAAPNYFDAQGLEIRTAFRSIAAQINALSLER